MVEALTLTVDQTAEALNVSRSSVWRLLKAGHLRAIYVGGNRRITQADLRDFLEGSPTHKHLPA